MAAPGRGLSGLATEGSAWSGVGQGGGRGLVGRRSSGRQGLPAGAAIADSGSGSMPFNFNIISL